MSEADRKLSPTTPTNRFKQNSLRHIFRLCNCLVCSNLSASERPAIHSFLSEGMMSPKPRTVFLRGGGFCLPHFWIAKRIEEECSPAGGLGVAILCENLLEGISSHSPFLEESTIANQRRRDLGFSQKKSDKKRWRLLLPSFSCTFCRNNQDREWALLEELNAPVVEDEWSQLLADAPSCLGHTYLALQVWQRVAARAWIGTCFRIQTQNLTAEFSEYIRKRVWQCHDEPRGSEQDAVPSIQFLVGLMNQFPNKESHQVDPSNGKTAGGKRHAQ